MLRASSRLGRCLRTLAKSSTTGAALGVIAIIMIHHINTTKVQVRTDYAGVVSETIGISTDDKAGMRQVVMSTGFMSRPEPDRT